MLKRHIALAGLVITAFTLAVNLHLPDIGETYVSRNLFPWFFMALAMGALWWRPLTVGPVKWQPDWLLGFLLPAAGAILVLFVQIIGGFADYHLGHYFLPGMLSVFALMVLGLLQYEIKPKYFALAIAIGLIAFLPQYLMHLIVTNPIVFFSVTIQLQKIFYKEFMGFAQYNIYGSFLVSCLLVTIWASSHLDIKRWQRAGLLFLLFVYALDVLSLNSKTALIGFAFGVTFFVLHLYQHRRDTVLIKRAVLTFAILLSSLALSAIVLYLNQEQIIKSSGWREDGSSFQTRYAMWVIAWNGFLESPLFGNGLGSYTELYTKHFSQYGLSKGLFFHQNVTLPHNLILHLLSETGLLGTVAILGPYIWLGVRILRHQPNRFLLIALAMPVLIHTQLEYPYIASSSHYLIFAIGIAAAMQGTIVLNRSFELPQRRNISRYVPIGLVGALALSVLVSTMHLQYTVYRLAGGIFQHSQLPLLEYIDYRYEASDISHPVLGRRMKAMSDINLAYKAIEAKEFELLRTLILPSLEKNVVNIYNTREIWNLMMRVYFALGEYDKAYKFADRTARFDPELGNYYRDVLTKTLQLKPPQPSRLPQ